MIDFNIDKFRLWLSKNGAEILPITNNYEALRFVGQETGILYKSGKVNSPYTSKAINSFKSNKKWDGKPINVGRYKSYRKQKIALIKRDGRNCFYCGLPLKDNITLEHLIALSRGGKNTLENMVLAHEDCNNKMDNKPLNVKIQYAIIQRLQLMRDYYETKNI